MVISCAMLMDEVKSVCARLCMTPKIIWLRRSMHRDPVTLRRTLQKLIDENDACDAILLTYGLCGNATAGLVSRHAKLVLPRFHDCIHQLVNERSSLQTGHYYLTRGWTLDKEELYQHSIQILQRYKEKKGREILRQIYGGYTDLDVIDTGAYPLTEVMEHAKKAAALLSLKVNQIPGSTFILEKLLTGNWDEDFIVLQNGEQLEQKQFFR